MAALLQGLRRFAATLVEGTLVNGKALKDALNHLPHFPNLPPYDRGVICDILIRNREIFRLILRVQYCPDSIPLEKAGPVYRAIYHDTSNLENHPFLISEVVRLKKVLEEESHKYGRCNISESGAEALIRLSCLLEVFGREGEETMFEVALAVYSRFNWLPAELKWLMPRILLARVGGKREVVSKRKVVLWRRHGRKFFTPASSI